MKPIIDVSEHNGVINWEVVKGQIDGAILRCGYGGNVTSQDDLQYQRNVAECTRLAIPMGVYLFSYAKDVAQAQDEADHVLRLVKGWNFSLPIYYDLEYTAYVGDLSANQYTQIANAFCERIEAAGGFVGIYANTYFWQTKLFQVDKYTRWVAQWAAFVTLEQPYQLWQYSSDGVIQGSSARTDVNRYYGDFLTMAGTKNQFGSQKPEPNPPIADDTKYKVGDRVSFTALYTSSTSTQKITNIAVTSGVISKVIQGANNPYLINNGTGWVNDSVIVDESVTPPPSTSYQVGDKVSFNALYTSSTSMDKITNIAVHEGIITRIIADAPNPYLINNGTGWVNASVIVTNEGSNDSATSFAIGDRVRVKQGATDYNGTSLASFVYSTTYLVMQVNGNRIVIGNGSQVTAAIHASNLYKV